MKNNNILFLVAAV